jgi:hypothetical protein
MSWQRGQRSVDNGDWDQLRADVGKRWKQRINTADISKELNVREADVERALHQILDARRAVNTVLGAG